MKDMLNRGGFKITLGIQPLPRNANGKLLKRALREQLEAKERA